MNRDSRNRTGAGRFVSVAALAVGLFAAMVAPAAHAAPANDAFSSAVLLTGVSANDMVSNIAASKEANEPAHAGDPGGLSVWWTWTAPSDGLLTVSTAGSTGTGGAALDTVMAIYTGNSLIGLADTEVVSNDEDPESPAGNTSRTLLLVRAGQTFQIAVDSSAAFGDPIGGDVMLTLSLDTAGNNDHLADRIALTGANVTRNWTNRGGTREVGEALHGGPGVASVWWEWTAPSDGEVTITTAGSLLDTRLAVYTGSPDSHANLLQFRNDDDSGGNLSSLIAFEATSGAKYYIAVESKDPAVGDFFFCISMGLPATTDSILRMPDGTTNLSLSVPSSCRIRIEYNEDLGNPNAWTRVQNGTFISPSGTVPFTDQTSGSSTTRFYRVITP